MKNLIGLLILIQVMISCTSGVSDGVKSVALGKALMGAKIKLPQSPREDDVEAYQAFKGIVQVNIESTEEVSTDEWRVQGEINIKDSQKVQGIFMAMAFSSKGKGETNTQLIERTIASVEKKISNTKGYLAKPLSRKFELHYKKENGKETITSFKEL